MNIILWAVQIVLATKFVSVAFTHGVRPDPAKMQRGVQRLGQAARPVLSAVAIATCVGGVCLIVPAATGVLTWLTPVSAALLAVMMLLAVRFHTGCRERPNTVVSLVLFALAAFVAYGRWVTVPL